jgi:hypothetical protein
LWAIECLEGLDRVFHKCRAATSDNGTVIDS